MSDLADKLAGLSPAKRALFERLRPAQASARIPRRDVFSPTPLSFGQERLWLLDRLDPDNAAYVVAHGIRFRGRLEPSIADRAIALLVERHEVLRTTFVEIEGRPAQRIAPHGTMTMCHVDLSGVSTDGAWKDVGDLARDTCERPFDLTTGPLFRAAHATLADDDQVLLFAMHHIISDAGSLEQLLREFAICCASLAQGVEPRLPALPIQFADFAAWQRAWFTGPVRDAQVRYWHQQLAGLEPLELPTDAARPAVQTFRGRVVRTALPADVVQGLKGLGQRHGTTTFMTLLAGFAVLLSRYTRRPDVAVGSPVANRTRVETEHVVGLFANTIVLRIDCGRNPTVAELLERTRQVVLDAHAHQDLPFEQLVDLLQPLRDLSRNPLFQVFFVVRRHARDEVVLAPEAFDVPSATAKFDLTVTFDESADGLRSTFEYNTDLFAEATIARLSRHLVSILGTMAEHPAARIADLAILTAAEREEIVTLGRGPMDLPAPEPMPATFVRVARREAGRTAIVSGDTQLSYGALDESSARVASWLRHRGIGAESLVGVYLDRTPELVACALGIVRAGAAYVPLDPAFPPERLRLMVEDARPALVVMSRALSTSWSVPGVVTFVLDDPSVQRELAVCAPAPDVRVELEQLAYVIYTSGSTGRPKGVQISHRALANFLDSMRQVPGLTSADRLLAVTTFSFDIAGLELWLPLTTGATVVLAATDDAREGTRLNALSVREQVSCIQATPSTWRLLCEAGWRPSRALKALVGGEALPVDLGRELLLRTSDLWNVYGPTETTIWSTLHRVNDGHQPSPIGRPIARTSTYVLDDRLEPVPFGVIGDLYIGGDGVARGYRGRPDLTAERFVPDPFARTAGTRMYRTGDMARLRPGGILEFLGRIDDQIKLRGFRIELGDVEAALASHPAVERAAAGIRPGADGQPALVGWYVATPGAVVDATTLRAAVRDRLPDYMVPSVLVPVESIPLTPNGKVDRRALPDPPRRRPSAAVMAPRTDTERQMAALWAETLGTHDIGVDDDFFELGGHSMLAAQLLARIRPAFEVDVPLRALFESPTVAGLARAVTVLREGGVLDTFTPSLRAELLADARLDPSVTPSEPWVATGPPAHVLLTGASGFLGAHLLGDLLATTTARVSCLVRCTDPADGLARLHATLAKYGLSMESFAGRVVAIPGDLEQPRFGLTHAAYDALSTRIDAIYHNGALVNFVLPYRRLRPANVDGTVEVLRLACRGRTKPVHYVSTMDVLGAAFLEIAEDDEVGGPSGLVHGYAQSKWVGERLVTMARERGVPVAIYRPGRVIGHSRTGLWNTEDFACRAIRGSIELGVVPDVDPIDNMAPVDYVSAAIVAISRTAEAFGRRAFHVINPAFVAWRNVFDLMRRRGYAVTTVSYRDWRRRLARAPENALAPLLPLFPVPPDEGPDGSGARWAAWPVPHCEAARAALEGSGVACPVLDEVLWARYFDYFLSAGYIAPAPH